MHAACVHLYNIVPVAEGVLDFEDLIELHGKAGDLVAAQRVLHVTAAMVQLQTGLPLSPSLRSLATRLGLLVQ